MTPKKQTTLSEEINQIIPRKIADTEARITELLSQWERDELQDDADLGLDIDAPADAADATMQRIIRLRKSVKGLNAQRQGKQVLLQREQAAECAAEKPALIEARDTLAAKLDVVCDDLRRLVPELLTVGESLGDLMQREAVAASGGTRGAPDRLKFDSRRIVEIFLAGLVVDIDDSLTVDTNSFSTAYDRSIASMLATHQGD